jgi:hypothetical protein
MMPLIGSRMSYSPTRVIDAAYGRQSRDGRD